VALIAARISALWSAILGIVPAADTRLRVPDSSRCVTTGPPRELSVYREATSTGLSNPIGYITTQTANHYALMMKGVATPPTARDSMHSYARGSHVKPATLWGLINDCDSATFQAKNPPQPYFA
jgi:hypothetical protein